MCGIVGAASLSMRPIPDLKNRLIVMNNLITHRGPDGHGIWARYDKTVGFGHRRLAIIELTESGAQPMHGPNGTVLTFNGEIYNYKELQQELKGFWDFRSDSDSETILAAYAKWGEDCVDHLRGMFAFAIWDEREGKLFAARDRFGIKPFYYAEANGIFYFASEIKSLMPVLESVETDTLALSEYISFQFPITERTMFKGVTQLMPGFKMVLKGGKTTISKYWDVKYTHRRDQTPDQAREQLRAFMNDSIDVHLRADVPIGSYLSGGVDSSLIALLAGKISPENNQSFHGKFTQFPGYDESPYAEIVAQQAGNTLHQIDITASDFSDNINKVIYHLDHPVAGPGSFPQYMVSKLTSQHVKVVLGGQGGDEIFGGYARYFVGYLEQLIKGGMEGRLGDPAFALTFESVIPNLDVLEKYKPLMSQFFSEGMFQPLNERFYRLINRSNDLKDEVDRDALNFEHVRAAFDEIFNDRDAVDEDMYLDSMTRFDFKRLLPALLQVEDRMSMAHSIESRVPIIDHPMIEYVATLPPNIKYEGGRLKELLRTSYEDTLPTSLFERRDKMGFPVPLKEWYAGELQDFVQDIFNSDAARSRDFMNTDAVLSNFKGDSQFSRKTWGLLSLEIWHQQFHDRAQDFRGLLKEPAVAE